ncbi:hypothetical protein EDB85DRAFT_2156541 [Lactarius pseudohatsudake]|nr:hypothetical protein EDB85DRAFT_2156541 [Lactarius pseudohatsudake]
MQSGHLSESSDGESEISRPSIHALGDTFSISPQDACILKGYVEEFQKADTDTWKTILEKAMGELYTLWPPNSTFNKKVAKTKIRTWFYNHYSRPHRQLIKFTRRWSARNAFYHENKEEVTQLAQKLSGGVPGSEAFLGALQDATTSLWKKLSIEEQEPYADIAKEWSEDKPPRDIQAKMAQAKFRGRIVRDFQTQLFKTCGMRSVVLVAYADKDGKPRAAMDDWNRVLDDGMSFSDFFSNWRDASMWHEWMKYCRKSFVPEDDQSVPLGRSRALRTKVKVVTSADGEPDIPSITLENGYAAKTVQTALRDYCNTHIRYISGRKNATVPWSKLSSDPPAWIEEECYPPGFLPLEATQEGWVNSVNLEPILRASANGISLYRVFGVHNGPAEKVPISMSQNLTVTVTPPVPVTPPLPPSPSPSPSPLRRNEEIEQISIPDIGESSRPPPSSISRPESSRAHHEIQRGTPIGPATYNSSDVPELGQERVKRAIKMTHKAKNVDTGRGSGGP